jgi:predicted PurR-regulated permease PerM
MRESWRISFSVSFATVGRIVCAQRMDVLRNLFGNVTAGIIRLLVTVGIIAAVGFFLVKPALETTRDISRETNQSIQNGFQNTGVNDISGQIKDVNRQVQREIRRSLRTSKQQGDAGKLINCIQRANQDVNKIQRCSERFQ